MTYILKTYKFDINVVGMYVFVEEKVKNNRHYSTYLLNIVHGTKTAFIWFIRPN